MERTTKSLEMANFVCKFNEQNLMDFYHEIVAPAFFVEKKHKLGKSLFFFNNVTLLDLSEDDDEKILAIAGRYIRDIELTREQYFDKQSGELVEDQETLDSSPSALFVLILNNHRLLYLKETAHAPTLDMFKNSILKFLKEATKEYLTTLPKEEKNHFIREIGSPDLTITPLTSESTLESFVKSYAKLEQVRIIVNQRNDEMDNEAFIETLQKKGIEANSNFTEMTHRNTKEGLEKTKVIEQILAATSQGNQRIELKGLTASGEELKGNNESFKIVTKLSNVTKDVGKAAKKMYNSLISFKEKGLVNIPKTPNHVKEKIKSIGE